MLRLWGAVAEWRRKRASFAEEWLFHTARAAQELEDLGFSAAEARALAAERCGERSRYRRDAARDAGADWGGLSRLIFGKPFRRTAWPVPLALLLGLALIYGLNPYRGAVWEGISHPYRLVLKSHTRLSWADRCQQGHFWLQRDPCVVAAPWVRYERVSTAPGTLIWGAVLLGGLLRLYRDWREEIHRRRLTLYGSVTLVGLTFLGASVTATGMQYFDAVRFAAWQTEILLFLLAAFGMLGLARLAQRAWWRDVELRCPECLEPLILPLERGDEYGMLLDPRLLEAVCMEGHGALQESRWQRTFASGGLWDGF